MICYAIPPNTPRTLLTTTKFPATEFVQFLGVPEVLSWRFGEARPIFAAIYFIHGETRVRKTLVQKRRAQLKTAL
jgi:hypothetical protein